MAVESKVRTSKHLRREYNLPGVLREMLDHMQHRLHARDPVLLNLIRSGKLFGGQSRDDRRRAVDGFAQFARTAAPAVNPPRASNSLSRSRSIRIVAQRRNNPLADIPRQMQREIADGVFVLAAARPDLIFIEFPEA